MAGSIDISDYLREYQEHGEIILRAKWTMDGAETLDEAAHMLRAFADELEALASAGFHLMGPVEDDYAFAHRGVEQLDDGPPTLRRLDPSRHRFNEDAGPARPASPTQCRWCSALSGGRPPSTAAPVC